MPIENRKKIIRLLGVGFDAEDGHIRVTQGDHYDVIMGSPESHEYITQLIQDIEAAIEKRGLILDDFSPEGFTELIQTLI